VVCRFFIKTLRHAVQQSKNKLSLRRVVVHLHGFSQTFCLPIFSPFFKLCDVCVEFVDVFKEKFD
jgi:hypothetical protein